MPDKAATLAKAADIYCHQFCLYRIEHAEKELPGLPDDCHKCPIVSFTLTKKEQNILEGNDEDTGDIGDRVRSLSEPPPSVKKSVVRELPIDD